MWRISIEIWIFGVIWKLRLHTQSKSNWCSNPLTQLQEYEHSIILLNYWVIFFLDQLALTRIAWLLHFFFFFFYMAPREPLHHVPLLSVNYVIVSELFNLVQEIQLKSQLGNWVLPILSILPTPTRQSNIGFLKSNSSN